MQAQATENAMERLAAPGLGALHGFFTRKGGVSSGIYASLNCGFGAKDDPSEAVAENRRRAEAALGAAAGRLVTVHQTHSADVVIAREPWTPADAPKADAVATDRPGIMLGVLSADCAPILLEDVEAGVIGAAHAGWRGAFDGVAEATVAAMEGLGAVRERIRAAIGPCIGPEAYEVGPEFVARFTGSEPADARFFGPPASEAAAAAGKARFDLPAYARHRLAQAGVGQAEWIGRCTFAEEAFFFSNRRATHRREGDYGRLLSAIMLAER